MQPLTIPAELPTKLRGYEPVRETIGQSGDVVFRLDAPSRPTLIVKVFDHERGDHLQSEAARINWLRSVGIQAPRVLDALATATHHWLVMECLPGANAAAAIDKLEIKVHAIATALASLHSLAPDACPFDEMCFSAELGPHSERRQRTEIQNEYA